MKKLKDTKVGQIIFKNFPLKILAAVIAIVLWIVVVNIEDPYTSNPISNIEITVYGTEALDEMGYAYQLESSLSLSIRVKAPQTVMDKLKNTDFEASVDVSQRTEADTCKVEVKCVGQYRDRVEILSMSEEYIKINIDNKISKTIDIQIVNKGEPQSGFVLGTQTVSPSTITVIGAETIINKIAKVAVVYDITDVNQSITETVPLHFYDENDKEISAKELARLESNRSSVRLDIAVLPTKWVDVTYALSGKDELAKDYAFESATPNLTKVMIAGTKEELAKISSIDVPADGMSIAGLSENTTLKVNLQNYLSSSYTIVSDTKVLTVDVKLNHLIEQEIEIPFDEIEIDGLNTDYKARITGAASTGGASTSVDQTSLKVKVYGEESFVKNLKAKDMKPCVTITNSSVGTISQKLTWKESNQFTVMDSYYVNVVITKDQEDPTQPIETEDSTETEEETTESLPNETDSDETTIGEEAEY